MIFFKSLVDRHHQFAVNIIFEQMTQILLLKVPQEDRIQVSADLSFPHIFLFFAFGVGGGVFILT